MKNYLITCLLLVGLNAFSEGVFGPPYEIKSDKKDASLGENESVIELKFFDSQMKAVKQVTLSWGSANEIAKTGSNNIAYLKLVPDTYTIAFYYNNQHAEVTTGKIKLKPQHRMRLEVYFTPAYTVTVVDKPVIYLYPEKKTAVNVQLDVKGEMLFSYPEYRSGWNFEADASGEISMNGKTFHYLFWDAQVRNLNFQIREGFDVKKEELLVFFEEKLVLMGLNSKEREDFITYWCPRMMKYEKVRLSFVFNEEYDQFASIHIQPRPDHLFRVMMLWRETSNEQPIPNQKLKRAERNGFEVIEWGGSELLSPELAGD